jgi:hypothetical protein
MNRLPKLFLGAVVLAIGLFGAWADNIIILWDPPIVTNGVTGYQITVSIGTNAPIPIFQATVSGIYSTQQVVTSLIPGTNYTGTIRSMSGPYLFSTPVSTNFTLPSAPMNLKINSTMQQSTTPNGPWEDVTNLVIEVVTTEPRKFYRSKLEILEYAR